MVDLGNAAMKRTSLFLGFFGLFAIACFQPVSAHAQGLIRTFVSPTGNNTNSCLREAPCLTFDGAYAKTAAGGEIGCTEAGTYGAMVITKSIVVDCASAVGSISLTVTIPTGIRIEAAATDKVILRNLTINGHTSGQTGIQYNSGAEVEIDSVTITGGNSNFVGINVTKSSLGILSVRNSIFSKMPVGIRLQDSAPNIVASVSNSNFNNLTSTGIEVSNNSYVGVSNSIFYAIYGYGINAATSTSTVYAIDNVFTNNAIGISATVAGAKISANGNKLYGNSKAFNVAAGATFLSAGDNKIDINPGNPPTGALTSR